MGDVTNVSKLTVDDGQLILGTTTVVEAELSYLDGLTPGTVTASKAVVVSSDKDIASFRNVTATGTATLNAIVSGDASLGITGVAATTDANGGAIAIAGAAGNGTGVGGAVTLSGGASAGATGTAGAASIDAGAATGGTGAAVNVGVTNASTVNIGGGSTTININAAQLTASAAELNALDITAAGTAQASKALVVNSDIDISTLRNVSMTGIMTAAAIASADASLGIDGKAGAGGGAGGAVATAGGVGHTNGAGGAVSETGGAGAGTGAGGDATLSGGMSGAGATGNGGAASTLGGNANSTDGTGGAATLRGGEGTGTGTGGLATIAGGASAGATGVAGSVAIDAGAATGGTGGTVTIGGTNATAVSVGRSGQTVNLKGTALTASADEINKLNGAPIGTHTFVIGVEGGNVINVGIQLNDGDAAALAVRGAVRAYLSDDAAGDSVAATAPSGGVVIGTDGLAIPVTPALTNALLVDGNLAISAVPEKFKTTQTAAFLIGGVSHTKAATDNLVFTAAHVITASKFGVILIQINAAGTVSTKVPLATQAYDDAPTALAALPAVDAGNVSLGYIAIENNAGDWTANTDDLADGVDVTTAAFTDSTEGTIASPKMWELVSESDGDIDINITEAGAATWYLILVNPTGTLVPSAAITFT